MEFVVNLDAPLGSVQVNGHSYDRADATLANSVGGEQAAQWNASEAASAVAGIESALSALAVAVGGRHDKLSSMAINCAIEAARVVLNSSQELVEERLGANLSRLLAPDSHATTGPAKIYVHSSCQEAVEQLLAKRPEESLSLEVIADDELGPGDCRADFGQSGQLAALDNQLEVVRSRLEQFAREHTLGGLE